MSYQSRPRICVPVTGSTVDEVIHQAQSIPDYVEFIEARLDYCDNLSEADISKLRDDVLRSTIVTIRSQAEGGRFSRDENERIHLIKYALTVGFAYVDIEYQTILRSPDLSPETVRKDKQSQIIVSYHDFSHTPTIKELEALIHQIRLLNPSIIKVATQVQSQHDQDVLIRLLTNLPQDQRYIIVGMGQLGKKIRLIAPYLGSYLTYAASPLGSIAPGQIDLKKLLDIYLQIQKALEEV